MKNEQQINEMTAEEIFQGAIDAIIKRTEASEDHLELNNFLNHQLRYVPILTTHRGSYNGVWEVKEMLKNLGITDWTTFTNEADFSSRILAEIQAEIEDIDLSNVVANETYEIYLNALLQSGKTNEEIFEDLYDLEKTYQKSIIKKVEHIEKLNRTLEAVTIIRTFKHIQETRGLKINLNKLRGVLLDLNWPEDGAPHIKYAVIVKRGTPATFGFYKTKWFKGGFEF